MKSTLQFIGLFLFIGFSSFAQNDDLEKLLTKPVAKTGCEVVSANVDMNINRYYENDSISELINFWEKLVVKQNHY